MRAFVVVSLAVAVATLPTVAHADGGAYIDLDQTYYVVGSTAVATTYVAIPKSKRSWLERGPFYAYVMDNRSSIRAGAPLPSSAVRVGEFTFHQEDGSFEFESRFTVSSSLSFGWHNLGLCNDPCTIAGFREPLSGVFSVVETQREADLLIENGRMQGQLVGVRRDLSKAERRLHALSQDLIDADRASARSTDQVYSLQEELASAQAEATAAHERSHTEHRAALIVAIELLMGAVVLVVLLRKRRYARRGVAVT